MTRSIALSCVFLAPAMLVAFSALGVGGCTNGPSTTDSGAGDAVAASPGSSVDGGLPTQMLGDGGDGGDGGMGRFQGTIEIVIEESPNKPTQRADELPATERYTFTALGDAYRWDLFEKSVARGDFRIYDRSAKRFYSVMQSQSTIFAVPESDKLLADATAAFVLEDLQKSGKVAGWDCKLFRTSTPTAHYDICATDKLTPFPFQMMPGLMQQVVPFGAELVNRKLYPLLVNQYLDSDAGAPAHNPKFKGPRRPIPDYSFRVVAIDQKTVDPVVFDLPKYPIQRVDLLMTAKKTRR